MCLFYFPSSTHFFYGFFDLFKEDKFWSWNVWGAINAKGHQRTKYLLREHCLVINILVETIAFLVQRISSESLETINIALSLSYGYWLTVVTTWSLRSWMFMNTQFTSWLRKLQRSGLAQQSMQAFTLINELYSRSILLTFVAGLTFLGFCWETSIKSPSLLKFVVENFPIVGPSSFYPSWIGAI